MPRRVNLCRCLDTLAARLALTSTGGLRLAELSDRSSPMKSPAGTSADWHAHAAGLNPEMALDHWDDAAHITYDQAVWHELRSLLA